ncbi:MAG: hypothetical protein IPN36_14715 [Bacteroidetes bacterium]|nr:hypothetical protein [Bacteroidota bacterium]
MNAQIYVNDNSTVSDVFTTAVGNDADAGTAAAPYATINFAISQAIGGETIYIDNGSYKRRVIVDKSLTLRGRRSDRPRRNRSCRNR